jgi:aspartyl-tRNA(Asn)/glutamyl-tRNA(Gln) amidotransferase subunit A
MTGDISGLKVGVIQERVNTDAVEPDIREAVVEAISVLGELGAIVGEVSIPLIADSAPISAAVTAVDAVNVHRNGIRDYLEQYDHNIQIRLLTGSIMPAQVHQKAVRLREMLRSQIVDVLDRFDVLVMPTSSIPASPLPTGAGVNSKEEVLQGFAGRRGFTAPFNLASLPALSVGCGFTRDNLPIGLQIAGKAFDESSIFQVAHAYQQATDWHLRRPPL